jgi:hypothetical protein
MVQGTAYQHCKGFSTLPPYEAVLITSQNSLQLLINKRWIKQIGNKESMQNSGWKTS